MIPTTEETTTQSNIEGKKISLRFDEDSLVHLMSILTEAYTDPELAVIREYATNGHDSHVEAGQTRPIEVETPSALKPTLTIRDFGVGLDGHDIENVYSLYGKSTKRETNEQVGALGIGAKSALAYTSQFTVIGVKNGVRTIVNVARDDEGAGSMTILSEEPTTDPNGVEIIVPVHRRNFFDEKARDLFRYWEPGTVLVNGKEPEHITGLPLTDKIMIVDRSVYGESSVLVMGNIPYEIPNEHEPMRGLLNGKRIVATVDIGDVHFVPSRERLQLTAKTKRALKVIDTEGQTALATSIQKDIDAAASKPEALTKALAWKRSIETRNAPPVVTSALSNLTYKGEAIPKSLQLPQTKNSNGEDYRPKFRVSSRFSGKMSDNSLSPYLESGSALNAILIRGYTADSFTSTHGKKLRAYADQNDLKGNSFALFNGVMPEGLDWFDRPIVTWDDVKAVKLDRTPVQGARKQLQGSYDVHERASTRTRETKADELNGDLYFYMTDTYKTHYRRGYNSREREETVIRLQAELFAKYFPDATLIRLGINRKVKFLRDFPHAKEAQTALKEKYEELLKPITPQQVMAISLRSHESYNLLRKMDPELVEDKALAEAIRAAQLKNIDELKRALMIFHHQDLNLQLKPLEQPSYDVTKAYPLLAGLSYGRDDKLQTHTYCYINAAYELDQELAKAHAVPPDSC